MQKFWKKMGLLIGVVLAADFLIPNAGWDELALQAVLITAFGGCMYLRQ